VQFGLFSNLIIWLFKKDIGEVVKISKKMAWCYELPVYRDTYNKIPVIFEYSKDFSRVYTHTLGQDMKSDALQLVRSI
jgi:hypothetical protein